MRGVEVQIPKPPRFCSPCVPGQLGPGRKALRSDDGWHLNGGGAIDSYCAVARGGDALGPNGRRSPSPERETPVARPAGWKLALVMTAVIGLGLVGARAENGATIATVQAGGHTASTDESLAATSGSAFTDAESLFAASNPHDWCSLGAQLPANFSGYCEIGPDQIGTNLGTGNCSQVQGAPEDAEIDGTAVAIDCPDQGGIAEGGGYMGMPSAGYGNEGGPGAICIWAIPTAATNVMEGDQGQNPAILTIGSDASAAFTFNGLTVDAPAGSVPLNTWTELCGYTNSVFGGTQYCIMLDDYTSCDSSGQNLVSYDENFTQNIQTLWGYGYWMSSAAEAVNEPPTYAMYGSSGCPGLPSAKCVAISDPSTGTSVLPALCGSPGTISADSAGDCTWANLPAFWFAVISAEERAAQKPLAAPPPRRRALVARCPTASTPSMVLRRRHDPLPCS